VPSKYADRTRFTPKGLEAKSKVAADDLVDDDEDKQGANAGSGVPAYCALM